MLIQLGFCVCGWCVCVIEVAVHTYIVVTQLPGSSSSYEIFAMIDCVARSNYNDTGSNHMATLALGTQQQPLLLLVSHVITTPTPLLQKKDS